MKCSTIIKISWMSFLGQLRKQFSVALKFGIDHAEPLTKEDVTIVSKGRV